MYDGGVIHAIDQVLTIPDAPSVVAGANDDLSTLVSALQAADLLDALDNTANVTIFAPSNAAFSDANIDLDTVDSDELTTILQYHVISGQQVYYSSSLDDGATVETMGGQSVTVSINDGEVMINDATVVTPNVLVANGVVHVIDQVLRPDSMAGGEENDQNAAGSRRAPTWLAGVVVSGFMLFI